MKAPVCSKLKTICFWLSSATIRTSSGIRRFAGWLADAGQGWDTPDLAAYCDHLFIAGLNPTSVAAHLATIRGVYAYLLRDKPTCE